MAENPRFDLNEALKYYLSDPLTVPTTEAASQLTDYENDPSSLEPDIVNSELDSITESVSDAVESILRPSIFDSLQLMLKFGSSLPPTIISKLIDLVVSSLAAEADAVQIDPSEEQDAQENEQHAQLLQALGFLLQWIISVAEAKAAEKPANALVGRVKGAKGSKAVKASQDKAWDSTSQILAALDAMTKVMKLNLAKIFVTSSGRDSFVSLFTKSVYLILESEARVKSTPVRMHCFKVLCVAVKHHNHAFAAQTSIIQNLSYFEHLAEPMAEFLFILSEQYDHRQLAEEVLRELSSREFNANDLKGPKSVAAFIIKLSELIPRIVVKQMTLLAKLLDSESHTLRCAVIEVCGNLIAMLCLQTDEGTEVQKSQIDAFFDVLEERFLDINPYCRCRAIQMYTRVCDLNIKIPKRRQVATELAARSLQDKSSHVRRNAVKLLAKLITTHPFGLLHGGQLSIKEWQARLDAVDAELGALEPPPELQHTQTSMQNGEGGDGLVEDATVITEDGEGDDGPAADGDGRVRPAEQRAPDTEASETINKLQLTRRYYAEAIRFIQVLHDSSRIISQLLSSKNKSEVIEAMDFFVVLSAYKVETARAGVRRMLRLIWTKGNSDEGKGVQAHLIDCYKDLFFDPPEGLTLNEAANYIARNMISLTFASTPAELTSLEQLLSTMMQADLVSEAVIEKLWQVYGFQKREISRQQRRGAIIILGMLAVADPAIVIKEMEVCLRIGLGSFGRGDLGLARYTCIALQRIQRKGRKSKEGASTLPKTAKLPSDHAVLVQLAGMTEIESDSIEWFGVAEQAINAIYALAQHPDNICSAILRKKICLVFANQEQPLDSAYRDGDTGLLSPPPEEPVTEEAAAPEELKAAMPLTQLLFVVGQVAIKQIVHLELCEENFKRQKAENEKAAAARTSEAGQAGKTKQQHGKSGTAETTQSQDELDLITGTSEDDFADAIAHLRERELLYGPQSLLATFGPMVTEICANNTSYPDRALQAQAALCMAKLMCVSSEYCEHNLGLLLTILSKSTDATVRSNLVVALGDMAVCFNHLIDENTDFLYQRLNDEDGRVRRTCLMTLTFLILAGQVKVKGQLGEMAKCLEDGDTRIAELSRMFFTELATKDNAIYNNFVDMFSLLSTDEALNDDAFKKIVKFLAGFIEKDKHAKQLAGKLAARLPRCENEKQWNEVAFAIGLLPHKDEDLQKVVSEGFKLVEVEVS